MPQDTEQNRRINWLEDKFSTINSELSSVKTDMAKIKTDVEWLKKTYWIVVSSSVGALIVGLFGFIMK